MLPGRPQRRREHTTKSLLAFSEPRGETEDWLQSRQNPGPEVGRGCMARRLTFSCHVGPSSLATERGACRKESSVQNDAQAHWSADTRSATFSRFPTFPNARHTGARKREVGLAPKPPWESLRHFCDPAVTEFPPWLHIRDHPLRSRDGCHPHLLREGGPSARGQGLLELSFSETRAHSTSFFSARERRAQAPSGDCPLIRD